MAPPEASWQVARRPQSTAQRLRLPKPTSCGGAVHRGRDAGWRARPVRLSDMPRHSVIVTSPCGPPCIPGPVQAPAASITPLPPWRLWGRGAPAPKQPDHRHGEIWICGAGRLYHGNGPQVQVPAGSACPYLHIDPGPLSTTWLLEPVSNNPPRQAASPSPHQRQGHRDHGLAIGREDQLGFFLYLSRFL